MATFTCSSADSFASTREASSGWVAMVLWIASVRFMAWAWDVQAMASKTALQRGVKTRMGCISLVLMVRYCRQIFDDILRGKRFTLVTTELRTS
ncbi:hypothetical protein EMIT0215P_20526 [Pseudomonas serboccidentalis]